VRKTSLPKKRGGEEVLHPLPSRNGKVNDKKKGSVDEKKISAGGKWGREQKKKEIRYQRGRATKKK